MTTIAEPTAEAQDSLSPSDERAIDAIGVAVAIERRVVLPALLLTGAGFVAVYPAADRAGIVTFLWVLAVAVEALIRSVAAVRQWRFARPRRRSDALCEPCGLRQPSPRNQVLPCLRLAIVAVGLAVTSPALGAGWATLVTLMRAGISLAGVARGAAVGFLVIGQRRDSARCERPDLV